MAVEKWMRERLTGNKTTKKMARVFRLQYFIRSKMGSPWKILTRLTVVKVVYPLCEGESGEVRREGTQLKPPFQEGLAVLL